MRPAAPSNPTRPTKHHLYFTVYADGDPAVINTIGYAESYAAARFVQTVTQDRKLHWISDDTLEIRENDKILQIKEHRLEDLMEYTFTKEEAEWKIPETGLLYRVMHFSDETTRPSSPTPTSEPEERPKTTSPKRHKTQKAPSAGQITVAQLAESLNIAPNKARNALRKANIAKPANGWTFDANDPIVKTITDILKSA